MIAWIISEYQLEKLEVFLGFGFLSSIIATWLKINGWNFPKMIRIVQIVFWGSLLYVFLFHVAYGILAAVSIIEQPKSQNDRIIKNKASAGLFYDNKWYTPKKDNNYKEIKEKIFSCHLCHEYCPQINEMNKKGVLKVFCCLHVPTESMDKPRSKWMDDICKKRGKQWITEFRADSRYADYDFELNKIELYPITEDYSSSTKTEIRNNTNGFSTRLEVLQCNVCDTKNPLNSKFCTYCGGSL